MSTWRNATTANWIAAARARESTRPDALFVDPYAQALAGPEGFAMLERQERAAGVSAFIPVRTRFVDDLILSATAATPTVAAATAATATGSTARQVVVLGAGLDARAFRLKLPPELVWLELDRADVFDAKEPKLAALGARPACQRKIVTADLREDWPAALRGAGFAPDVPTLWIAEGLFFYLTEPSVRQILQRAAEMTRAAGTVSGRFFADMMGTGVLSLDVMAIYLAFLRSHGLPQPFCTDQPADLMTSCGWTVERLTGPGQPDASYRRFSKMNAVAAAASAGEAASLRTHLVIGRRDGGAGGVVDGA